MAAETFKCETKQECTNFSKMLQCRFHEKEEYQIFCKDCKDFMCFECLGQLHQKHDLCRLQDAEEDIRNESRTLFLKDIYSEKIHAFSEKVSKKQKELIQNEERLKSEIVNSANQMKQRIDISVKRLLSELRNTFECFQLTLQNQETNINNLQSAVAKLDVDKLHEYNINHIIFVLSEMKLCHLACDKCMNLPEPVFTPVMDFSVGNIMTTSIEIRNVDASSSFCSDKLTQTDFLEDSDTEWFDAEDITQDNFTENSSDEITDEYPIKLKLSKEKLLIRKIAPVAEKDAWIIVGGKLGKIVDHSLEDDVYADKVSDIVVLKDGCVLVLRSCETYIMKLLTDRRLVRFADVCTINKFIFYYPYCACITKDDLIIIYLWYESGNKVQGYHCRNSILWMNTDGIMTRQLSFNDQIWQQPCSIYNLESGLCMLYRVDSVSKRHRICILEAISSKCKSQYDFKGIYGLSPETNFECEGMCVDNAGHLLISDFRHHSVYVLDKELKYKKTLFDARNGLDEPAAIALYNDHLWISDQNQIFIFQYSQI